MNDEKTWNSLRSVLFSRREIVALEGPSARRLLYEF